MPAQIKLSGFTRLHDRLEKLSRLDFTPLMEQWAEVLEENNRASLGLDGKGNPLQQVRYRPKPVRKVDFTVLAHNNLTRSHYRTLDGPPLAPRGLNSRIVTNFAASGGRKGDDWAAVGVWRGVLDPKGRPFLSAHFRGEGRLPKRDLRGVRPEAMKAARAAARDFVKAAIRSNPT